MGTTEPVPLSVAGTVFAIALTGGDGPSSQSPAQHCAEIASGKARSPGQMRSDHLVK